jgi:primosomal protein N' (replication factor Y)
MDTDALKQKDDYQRILAEFRVGKTDILMGTQMIAKGLDFPNVTLVGIVYADQSLHLPDFRATERTFQLLTQVSGRAGRGDVEGEVIVQTFTPFHPSIQFARHHDFEGFYEQEAEFRRQLQYPPFVRLALLTLKARSEDKVRFCADYLRKQLETEELRATVTSVSGPAPAPLLRLGGFFRYQLLLRTRTMSRLAPLLAELQGNQKLPHGVKLTVNVDPVSFL